MIDVYISVSRPGQPVPGAGLVCRGAIVRMRGHTTEVQQGGAVCSSVHYPLVLPDLITLHPSVGQFCPIRQDLPMFSLLKLAQAHSSAGTPSSSPAFEGNKPASPPPMAAIVQLQLCV